MAKLSDVEKAYLAAISGRDRPDVILLPDGVCPVCKHPWEGEQPYCIACKWPECSDA